MIENVQFFLSILLNNSHQIYMHEFCNTEILFYFLWIVKLCLIVYL